jgi:hypothetical protein
MRDVICLPLPDGGEICFVIPILVNNDPFPPPEEVEGPSPDPWIIA